jgi:hypothetical protein
VPHIILGLTGKKDSGKTHVAEYLCEKFGFVEITVAEPLKEIIGRYLFYFIEDQLYGDKKEVVDDRWGVSPRFVFKDFGKYLKLRYGEDFLSKRTMFRIGELMTRYPKGVRVVVSDCRFPRELDIIDTVGGFTCRVVRTDAVYEDEDESETAADHVSTAFEVSAKTGELDKLYAQVDKMMEKIIAI